MRTRSRMARWGEAGSDPARTRTLLKNYGDVSVWTGGGNMKFHTLLWPLTEQVSFSPLLGGRETLKIKIRGDYA